MTQYVLQPDGSRKTIGQLIVKVDGGKGPSGLPNHWAMAPVYSDEDTGETWCAEDEVRSVHPDMGRKLIKSGGWQKLGEIEQGDMRSNARSLKWHDQEPRKAPGPNKVSKAKAS